VAAVDPKHAESLRHVKKLADEVESTRRKLAVAEAALKAANESKQQAESLAAAAAEKSKQLATARKAVDARVTEAKKVATPQSLTDFAPSTPILLTIKNAPIDVSASVPKGGELKRGARLDVKVKVRRSRGFKGPVTVGLPLPPGVAGIKAEAVSIPAAKSEAVLTIAAEKPAVPGAVANLVIRGAADFEGQAEVDAPITLKVVP
jgi:hypothetical protein